MKLSKAFRTFCHCQWREKKAKYKKKAKLFLLLLLALVPPSASPSLPCTCYKFVDASLLILLHSSGIFALLCTRVSYGFNRANRNSCRCVMKTIKYLIKIFTMHFGPFEHHTRRGLEHHKLVVFSVWWPKRRSNAMWLLFSKGGQRARAWFMSVTWYHVRSSIFLSL